MGIDTCHYYYYIIQYNLEAEETAFIIICINGVGGRRFGVRIRRISLILTLITNSMKKSKNRYELLSSIAENFEIAFYYRKMHQFEHGAWAMTLCWAVEVNLPEFKQRLDI